VARPLRSRGVPWLEPAWAGSSPWGSVSRSGGGGRCSPRCSHRPRPCPLDRRGPRRPLGRPGEPAGRGAPGVAAAVLLGFGLYRLIRTRHPGRRDAGQLPPSHRLVLPHGLGARRGADAGPLLLGGQAHAGHTMHMPAAPFATPRLAGSGRRPHLGPPAGRRPRALLVYEKLGLSLLRRAAFNLDLLWGSRWWSAGW